MGQQQFLCNVTLFSYLLLIPDIYPSRQEINFQKSILTKLNLLLSEKRRKLEESKVETAQLIDIKDSASQNNSSNIATIVAGAESCSKTSQYRQHSYKSKSRRIESMDTDTLIDLSEDTGDKRPFAQASLPLNGAIVYKNNTNTHNDKNDDDDDDTQDYSLSGDNQETTVHDHQTVMESMSPTF